MPRQVDVVLGFRGGPKLSGILEKTLGTFSPSRGAGKAVVVRLVGSPLVRMEKSDQVWEG